MNKQSYPKLHSIKWKDGAHAENVICSKYRGNDHIPVRDVLIGAYEENLREVVVAGYNQDGEEIFFGSNPNCKEAAYLFSRGQLAMLRYADD